MCLGNPHHWWWIGVTVEMYLQWEEVGATGDLSGPSKMHGSHVMMQQKESSSNVSTWTSQPLEPWARSFYCLQLSSMFILLQNEKMDRTSNLCGVIQRCSLSLESSPFPLTHLWNFRHSSFYFNYCLNSQLPF